MSGCQQRPGAGLIHHSDRGVQYASHEYRSVLAAANITASIFAFIEGFYNRPDSIPRSDISPDRDGTKSRLNLSTFSGED
ncbi:transposase InsO family protein [Bradyrhizobium sp. AZCC 1610]